MMMVCCLSPSVIAVVVDDSLFPNRPHCSLPDSTLLLRLVLVLLGVFALKKQALCFPMTNLTILEMWLYCLTGVWFSAKVRFE